MNLMDSRAFATSLLASFYGFKFHIPIAWNSRSFKMIGNKLSVHRVGRKWIYVYESWETLEWACGQSVCEPQVGRLNPQQDGWPLHGIHRYFGVRRIGPREVTCMCFSRCCSWTTIISNFIIKFITLCRIWLIFTKRKMGAKVLAEKERIFCMKFTRQIKTLSRSGWSSLGSSSIRRAAGGQERIEKETEDKKK